MDIEYDNKLKAIMAKHNADKWNADCENDPEYHEAVKEKHGFDLYEANKQASEYRSKRAYHRSKKPSGTVTIGSYKFRSKKN